MLLRLVLAACSGSLLLAALAAQTPQTKAAPPATPAPTFPATVAQHFDGWDADDDLTLSVDEIDRACLDPKVTGAAAAAIAAIKRVVRSDSYAVPPLTLDGLTKGPRTRATPPAANGAGDAPKPAGDAPAPAAKPPQASDADRADSGETRPAAGAPKRAPNFAASFRSGLSRIQSTPRVLFADDTPDLDACRQGPIGDCWLVASVGAFVHRDPKAIAAFVTPTNDGFRVRFRDGQSVEVKPLTDAELALSGTTGDEGLWLPVVEKAFGQLRQLQNPQKHTTDTPSDALAGGSTATVLRMLTGHKTERLAFHKKVPASTTPPSTPPEPVMADTVEALAEKAHAALAAAFAERRLVTASTNTAKHPPGIPGKHAYAVLGYDPAARRVTVWNPHGRSRKVDGEPGLHNGYAIDKGVFALPLREFVQAFSSMAWETSTPLPTAKGK
jgi:hypothetical protein